MAYHGVRDGELVRAWGNFIKKERKLWEGDDYGQIEALKLQAGKGTEQAKSVRPKRKYRKRLQVSVEVEGEADEDEDDETIAEEEEAEQQIVVWQDDEEDAEDPSHVKVCRCMYCRDNPLYPYHILHMENAVAKLEEANEKLDFLAHIQPIPVLKIQQAREEQPENQYLYTKRQLAGLVDRWETQKREATECLIVRYETEKQWERDAREAERGRWEREGGLLGGGMGEVGVKRSVPKGYWGTGN